MKLHQDNFPVQIQGADSGTSQFSIAMNSKAFRVLSDNLYQDKIGSLVREISTNAYDGHVAAGNQDQPFDIHLPDNFEPWFAVRDFGVGLSCSDIKTIFTTYFMSTKDQSDDMVGAFGLGAKTPFAYTDQFTVSSNYNGVKTIYSAFIDGNGIPNIAEMHSEQTSESNGVEVKIAVKTEDFYKFKSAVAHQLRYFKVKPKILNCEHFEFASVTQANEQSIIGQDYVITPSRSELIAIQGQIGYVVDRNKIVSDDPEVSSLLSSQLSIRIEFPIGEIGVTASRESIEYDKRTVDNIIAKLKSIYSEVQKDVNDKLSVAKCGWDRIVMLNGILSYFKASANLQYPNVYKNSYGGYTITTSNGNYSFFTCTKRHGYNQFYRTSVTQIVPSENTSIILVDAAKPKTEVLLKVHNKCQSSWYNMYLVFIDKKADVAKIKKEISDHLLGFDNFYLHSELVEKKPRGVRTAVTKPKATFFEIEQAGGSWGRSHEAELPEEFVYIECSRGKAKIESDYSRIREFFTLKALPEMKDKMQIDLLAIPVSEVHKLKDSGGIPLADFLEEIKDDAPVEQIASKIRKGRLYSLALSIYAEHGTSVREAILQSSSKYGKIVKVSEQAVVKYQGLSSTYNKAVADIFGLPFKDYSEKADKIHATMKAKHPILKISDTWLRDIPQAELVKLLEVTV